MAARFWVGGTGNIDDTAHWSTSSGGGGGSSMPIAGDTATFDGASGGGTVTGNVAFACDSMTCGAFTGTLDFSGNNGVTLISFSISGTGARTLKMGTTAWVITGNAATIVDFTTVTSLTMFSQGTFNCTYAGATGTRTIVTSSSLTETTCPSISISAGTDIVAFSANNKFKNVDFTGFAGTKTNTTSIAIYGNFTLSAGMTLTGGANSLAFSATSGIQLLTSNGNTFTFPLTFSGAGGTLRLADSLINSYAGTALTLSGYYPLVGTAFDATTNSTTVTLTGAAGKVSGWFTGNNSFYNLTVTGTAITTGTFTLSNDITCTNNFTVTGNSAINRILVSSSSIGMQRTITCAGHGANHGSGVDWQDIIGAGAATWDMSGAANYSGDCGGNTMKALGSAAFTTAATQTSTGTASFTWSTHGWTSRVPLPQDNVSIPNAFVAGRTISADMPRLGKSITCSCTGSPTLVVGQASSIFGSLDLTGIATWTGGAWVISFQGRGSYTWTSPAITLDQPFTLNAPNGTLTMASNITLGNTATLTPTLGTFDTGAYVLSTGLLSLSTGANGISATLNLNAGTHLLTGTGNVLSATSLLKTSVLNAGTSTVKVTNTSNTAITFSNAKKLYDVWFARGTSTATNTLDYSGIYHDFKDTGTIAHIVRATAGNVNGVDTFTVVGNAGQLITLSSDSAGSRTTWLCKTGTINCDYITSKDLLVGGGATWNAGANSTFSTGNYFGTTFGWADAPTTTSGRWMVAAGNWSSVNTWATSDGGAPGASVPIGERVYLTATSGANTLTVDTSQNCGDFDCTGFTGTLAGTANLTISGFLKLVSGMTVTFGVNNTLTFGLSGTSKNIDFSTKTLFSHITFAGTDNKSSNLFADNGFGDVWTMVSNLNIPGSLTNSYILTLTSGTLDANGYNVIASKFSSSNTNSRTLKLGTGIWQTTSISTVWDCATSNGLTVIPSTSTIKISDLTNSSSSKTFAGGNKTYYNLWFTGYGTGDNVIVGSNTFNDIKVDNYSARSLLFTVGTKTTFNSITVSGVPGILITIGTSGGNTPHYLNPTTGSFSLDYVSVANSYVIGTGYAGTHSVNSDTTGQQGNNTNWLFAAPSTQIAGQVTLSGAGVSGANVRLIREEDNYEVGKTTTDGSGNYSFYADSTKTYHVCVDYTSGGNKYSAKSLWSLTPA